MQLCARRILLSASLFASTLAPPHSHAAGRLRREKQLFAPTGSTTFAFGGAVAIEGDTALVGASDGSGGGSVYVYVRSGTTWSLQQTLVPHDPATYTGFGGSVALSGGLAVVGAFNADTTVGTQRGAAYVFARVGTNWAEQAKLVASDGAEVDGFGWSVAIVGETVVVGAPSGNSASLETGAAYVFVPGMFFGTWVQQQKLLPGDGAASDHFGVSVAVSGDTAVVGAYMDDNSSGTDAGAAYVFTRTGVAWTQTQKLVAPDGASDDVLGYAVALEGDTVVVTAPGTENGAFFDAGSAYVFVRSGGTWMQQAKLVSWDAWNDDFSGNAVALSGDRVLVGVSHDDPSGQHDAGGACVFARAGGGWSQQQRLAAWDGAAEDRFAYALALSGDTALVGAPSDATTAGSGKGSAHVFRLFAKGDLDRDGQTDLLVRLGTTGQTDAWLMNGVTRPSAPVTISPLPPSLDWSVVASDDFNADRSNDLLVWNRVSGAAEFWLMNGAARVGPAVPLTSAPPPPWKPSATADFDRDGRPDIVYRNFTSQEVTVWAMNNTSFSSELRPTPDHAVDSNWEIVGAQDWNGDGNTDFLWYNATSGKIVLWFLDENLVRLTGLFTTPANAGDNNWRVLAMGDYGVGPGGLAGTIDIVWRNATSGRYVVWYMDQAGTRTSGTFTSPDAPSADATAWTIVGPR